MKIIIIDDEVDCRNLLKAFLKKYCPDITLIVEADSVKTGCQTIIQHQPDIVFLDIKMSDGTGFDLLNQVTELDFKIIFTTAFDNYAIKAFKYSAVHYLLKPIDFRDFKESYHRASTELATQEQNKQFLKNYEENSFDTLFLKTEDSFHKIPLADIEYIQADGSYCSFSVKKQKRILISKPLKEYEQLLPKENFIRTHKSYLVNINHVRHYNPTLGQIVMQNNDIILVSRRNKRSFLTIAATYPSIRIDTRYPS